MPPMLRGEVEHQLDERGRVAVPRSFRETFEHGAFVTRGWYGCLFLFPWEKWRKIEDKLEGIGIADMEGDMVREFFSGGAKVFLDRQGRFVLPAALREWAEIESNVVIRGVIGRAEVWAKNRWQAFQKEQFVPERIMEKAAALGIS